MSTNGKNGPAAAPLIEALEALIRQYPNPDIAHVDYRVHACRSAEQALADYRSSIHEYPVESVEVNPDPDWAKMDPSWVVDFVRSETKFDADKVELMLQFAIDSAKAVCAAPQGVGR